MSSLTLFANSTLTNTGESMIQGDIALSPGTAITGFPPGVCEGKTDLANAASHAAFQEGERLFTELAALPHHLDFSGRNLGNIHLSPGTYHFSSSAFLTGDLVLSGVGRHVFQIASTLVTASQAQVLLVHGATPDQVFWQVGSSATLGTGTHFVGTVLARESITLTTGTIVQGALYALGGAVTLDSVTISALA